MREIVYAVAATLDGFIAHADGSLAGFPWDADYGARLGELFPEMFPAHLRGVLGVSGENRRFDTVLMGRSTWEVGLREGITSPYPHLRQFLLSRSLDESPDPDVTLADHAVLVAERLRREDGLDVWLCGGARIAEVLLRAGLLDRLIVKLNPVVFGSGIPLFGNSVETTALDLEASEVFASGHAILEYTIRRGARAKR